MFKQSKESYWMSIAESVSTRSPDSETKVGAVLVKNDTGMIVATAHNGFVRGADDESLPNTKPDKYDFMVHAEENIISHCARNGIAVDNCKLIITLSPCQRCLRLMWQAGITDVVCRDLYKDYSLDMKDICIEETTTEEGFKRLAYVIRD